jgi:hypothetical protein
VGRASVLEKLFVRANSFIPPAALLAALLRRERRPQQLPYPYLDVELGGLQFLNVVTARFVLLGNLAALLGFVGG